MKQAENMKKILVIAFTDLKDDPRVSRQIHWLRRDYRLTTVGLTGPGLEDVEFHPISALKRPLIGRLQRMLAYKFHRFESIYWSLYDFQPLLDRLAQQQFDLIIANDIETLPFALRLANRARVLADLHEYAPRQFEDQLVWRFFFQAFNEHLCKAYLKSCDEIMTASPGFVPLYQENYGIEPLVIGNETDYTDLQPQPVNPEQIRIISHGVAIPHRKLELMMKIMDYTDSRFHLDLMLLPVHPGYYRRLQTLATRRPNVSILPPVAREDIIPITNHYDLSFMIFKPLSTNVKYALSNKFFESLQARLAIVMGTSHQPQVEILQRYGCGLVVDNFNPKRIAARLNRLSAAHIEEYKHKSHLAAAELTAQKNREKLREIVKRLVNRSPSQPS
jgi:hypothetical protein